MLEIQENNNLRNIHIGCAKNMDEEDEDEEE
jgi:hypothetical protein